MAGRITDIILGVLMAATVLPAVILFTPVILTETIKSICRHTAEQTKA